MKKLLLSLIAVLISSVMMAGSFVKINYNGRAELEKLFASTELTIHFYNDSEVFATTDQFNAQTMTLIDGRAFEQNDVYTLVYCPADAQQAYLAEKDIIAMHQSDNYLIVKGNAMPYKNDGAVAPFDA